jgi:hypothetical protein
MGKIVYSKEGVVGLFVYHVIKGGVGGQCAHKGMVHIPLKKTEILDSSSV